ncbi:Spo0E family sporulation regulatory protein-aspartic acid phosphatase [Alkalihalobacillus deserti]|uniref:Spo0E family sporulation regulatory protein-aspartic acid phosphatase n=1 Tax=Alkalihalobacillus deserti TaxID=2879466 RepID=UPI001D158883|nr:Spo0E family sporulation regulatory protein-aspartic acid phosphatase [Alkalihalobacillus deserti]
MFFCTQDSLRSINRDIYVIRGLMYNVKERLGSFDDPLVIEISQFLDLKLNRREELMNYGR